MSLIRNGGFERGNTDFWTVETDGTLEIDSVNQKYGLYCGKYTAGIVSDQFIINNDYIEVNPFDLFDLFMWIKSITTRVVYPSLYMYDADYSYIDYLLGMSRTMTGAYININTQLSIPEGVDYVRAGFEVTPALADVFYFDGYSANIIKADRILSGNLMLANESYAASSGNTSTDKKDLQMYKTFEADLIVTSSGGTNPTLDITVYEMNLHSDKVIVGTFTQATGITQQRISLTHCTGRQLYIEYVITGTDGPHFAFRVYVSGKR